MNLTSAFLNRRDITDMGDEQLEDLSYHLGNRRDNLLLKMEQIKRDLADLEGDAEKVRLELTKRRKHI